MPTLKKVYFVSIRNLQVHVFRLDTDILNRGVSIRNLGLIATIGLPLPAIDSGSRLGSPPGGADVEGL